MTRDNFIIKAWDKEEKKFLQVLSIVRSAPTKDAVHDLRVSIKRLRSYLTLNTECGGHDHRHAFVPLKKLFSVSGKYRDLQMTLGMARKHGREFPAFSKAFEPNIGAMLGTTQSWTQMAAKEFNTGELQAMKELLQKHLGQESNSSLRDLIKKKIYEQLEGISSLSADLKKNAHEIRKKGKLINYWIEILPPPPLFNDKEKQDLDKGLDILGKRQDHIILQYNLALFTKQWIIKDSAIHHEAEQIMGKITKDEHELLDDFEKINLPHLK